MRPRNWKFLPLVLLTLAGCEHNRDTAGVRADVAPSAKDRIKVDFNDLSLKNALRIEDAAARPENGFLVVQLKVRNTGSKNLPCEWRASFLDKDGMEMPVAANPWTPLVLNSNVTESLTKTAPTPGAERAVFHVREASPLRK